MKLKRKRIDNPSLGGLLATRRGALMLALVCALAATGVLFFALGKYRHAVSTVPKQDTVLVATSDIKKGTEGSLIASQELYKVTPVLVSQVSAGAIINATALNGRIAANNIFPGQQLTAADFSTAASIGVAAQLTPTERGVSLTLDGQHGLGAVLQTGDHVDVYGSYTVRGTIIVSLLVPDALTLKAPSASTTSGSVLLGVNMLLAPRLLWMADNGKVWLVLRGFNAVDASPSITGPRSLILGDSLDNTPTYSTGAKR